MMAPGYASGCVISKDRFGVIWITTISLLLVNVCECVCVCVYVCVSKLQGWLWNIQSDLVFYRPAKFDIALLVCLYNLREADVFH